MTYLALTRTTRIKAAVVLAGMTDAVRSIAERHGAEVTLGDSPLGGLRVALALPASAADSPA